MFRTFPCLLTSLGLALVCATAFAKDPVLPVECLCVSSGEGKARGLTNRTWEEVVGKLQAFVDNRLVVVLSPSEAPGDHHARICDELTESIGTKRKPYIPSATPIRITVGTISKHKPGDDYKSSVAGFIKQ